MAQRKPFCKKRTSLHQLKRRNKSAINETTPHQGPAFGSRLAWARYRAESFPVILLILITSIAYANAWPDNLVWDDTRFALNERFSGIGLADITNFFTEDLWAVEGFNSGLYRPLLLISILSDSLLFGDWMAGYHLMNIFLHVLTTVLVYGLVRHLLHINGGQAPLSGYIALLAALVFGVHPIHTEVVNSIFNRSEILVSLGVVGGLWWFLKTQVNQPRKAWSGLSLIYLLVLFCRESSAALPALAVILLWTTLPGSCLLRLRKSVPVLFLLIPLGIYLLLRSNALDAPHVIDETSATVTRNIGQLTGAVSEEALNYATRLLNAVRLWADSLIIMVWPHPLQMYHGPSGTNIWLALVIQLSLIGLAIAGFINQRPGLFVGLAFFYLAMLPSSGIIGGRQSFQLAERSLYLPSVGLTIALAFGLRMFVQRFNLRTGMVLIGMVTVTLTPLTWARNAEWADNVLLAEADYSKGVRNIFILQGLVQHNLQAKNYRRAVEICDLHRNALRAIQYSSTYCGLAYEQAGRFDEAEQTLLYPLEHQQATPPIHFTLASMYLRHGRKSDARKHFDQGIAMEKQAPHKEFLIGFMLTELHPYERARLLEARAHFEKALELQPQFFQARQILDELNERLGPGE